MFVFCTHSHRKGRDFTSLAPPRDLSVLCIKYAVGSVPYFSSLFFATAQKTRSKQGLEGKKETGSGKRPVSPHLQPEPCLKWGSQHRRPMTHIKPNTARQTKRRRVSEPSARDREREREEEKVQKRKTANLQRLASEKKCQSRL